MSQAISPKTFDEMIAYYRARAGEYDQWFYRQGRYDRGEANNARWFSETRQVLDALSHFGMEGDVLELACGTGIWTQRLAEMAYSVTAVDASPEVIEINRNKVQSKKVRYVLADLFAWKPPAQYDGVFFGFWMSHVPADRLGEFWRMVGSALRPGGKVFFVDSKRSITSTAIDHQRAEAGQLQTRKLDDGREFRIVKVYHEPDEVAAAAAGAGMEVDVRETGEYFIYGNGYQTGCS